MLFSNGCITNTLLFFSASLQGFSCINGSISTNLIFVEFFNSSLNKNNPDRRNGVFRKLSFVESSYMEFINKMLKSLIKMEEEFKSKNKISYNDKKKD